MEFCTFTTASAREYCDGSTRRASSVARLSGGTATRSGHFPFGLMRAICASPSPDMRATVSPPIQQAEALSGDAPGARLLHDPVVIPVKISEVHGESDSRESRRRRGAATFPNRNIVHHLQG